MTTRSELLDKIRRAFSIWAFDIKQDARVNRLTGNIDAEDIAAGLLNLIYGYNLANANASHQNQKGIDLLDTDAEDGGGVAVQVTSSNTRQKATRTMNSFCEGAEGTRLCDEYAKLILLIISTEEKFKGWDKLSGEDYTFSIQNLVDLSKAIEHFDLDKLEQILAYLNKHLGLQESEAIDYRKNISRIARILDRDAVAAARENFREAMAEAFFTVDINFDLMLSVVSADRDIPHPGMNRRLWDLCQAGTPAILTGNSGTGKSTIMLRTAVSWARSGLTALWVSFREEQPLSEAEAAQFYQDLHRILPADQPALLCLDNPAENLDAFRSLAHSWPNSSRIHLLLAERANRLARLTSATGDLLYHWFDGAVVMALMEENRKFPFRVKDYDIEYIPDEYQRKHTILSKTIPVLSRRGGVRLQNPGETVRRILKDFGRSNVSLVELIYRAQFDLQKAATKPENLRMDWDEWRNILRKELKVRDNAVKLYGVIALCNLFEIPASVSLFCRFFDTDRIDLLSAIWKWSMDKHIEPVIYRESTDTLIPKHDVIAELFFLFHRNSFPFDDLMLKLLEAMNEYEIEPFLVKIVA